MRKGAITRKTKETSIEVALDLDGSGASDISTGVGFFDHMLDQLARHSLIDLTIRAEGDRHIDDHHTVEDVGIALGQALAQALGDKRGLTRYADCLLPMDETLTRVALDVSGRPFLVFRSEFPTERIGSFDTAARARVLPGLRRQRRPHAAHRDALRHEQPPHRGIELQGRRARVEGGRRHRSAPGRARALDERRPLGDMR